MSDRRSIRARLSARRGARFALIIVAIVVFVAGLVGPPASVSRADASEAGTTSGTVSGARISIDPGAVLPGGKVTVSFEGWTANNVSVAVCGNQALRGAADCEMLASKAVRLRHLTESSTAQLVVDAPKVPCPCVVRAVAVETNESSVVPIDIIGAPTTAARDVPFELGTTLSITVTAHLADVGLGQRVKSALGGATKVDLDVTVQNVSAIPIDGIVIDGTGGRRADSVDLAFQTTTGRILPGERWQTTIPAVVPSPAYGIYTWQVTASGTGPAATATTQQRIVPLGLLLLVVALTGVVVAIAVRLLKRRSYHKRLWNDFTRARRTNADSSSTSGPTVDDIDGTARDAELVEA